MWELVLLGQAPLNGPDVKMVAAVGLPKVRTNNFKVSWDARVGYYIQSNRVTIVIPPSFTNRYYVGDTTQAFFSVVSTQFIAVPRWTVTVATLGIEWSGESKAVYWPPWPTTNVIIAVTVDRLTISNWFPLETIFQATNPPDNRFFRLKPMVGMVNTLKPQQSGNLFSWTNMSPMFMFSTNGYRLNITNWSY